MTKCSVRRSIRPMLEALEDRCTPTATVTGSLTNGVWRLTGDNEANAINVVSSGSPGAFTVAPGPATIVAGVTNPTGVHKIVFDMRGAKDTVSVKVAKLSSMVFQGGDGDNIFTAERFNLADRLQVVNGLGSDTVSLRNFKIGGNVNINNGSGGSNTTMGTLSAAAGFNNVAGNVNITNGTGRDYTGIIDTNVGGNITFNNGAGDGINAGGFEFYNTYQTGKRAVVGGNIKVSFQDGKVADYGIFDAVVRGNVLLNNGSGAAQTAFDGFATTLPVVIQGRLKIVGTGTNLVSIGRQFNHTGLKVGQNLVIDVVNPADLTLEAFNLIVNGQTKII